MVFNRRVRDRMSLILFLLGNIATVALSDLHNEKGLNLVCTNDYDDTMSCDLKAQNCAEYNLTLRSNDGHGEKRCIIKQCDTGRCCCSAIMDLYGGETHTAIVFKGGQRVESKNISVWDTIKPRAPTIISVEESNGYYEVKWTANCKQNSLRGSLTAEVTYHKKGDTEEVSENITTTIVDGPNSYDILCNKLESNTTYLISMKSYTSISGLVSDRSEEYEFRTPADATCLQSNPAPPRHVLPLAVIICLSIASVIITSIALGCFAILKAKWRDTFAKCPNPELLDIRPGEQKILKPLQTSFSSVFIDTAVVNNCEQRLMVSLTESSSGMSTGSSSANIEPADIKAGVQDALSKAFAHIGPKSSMTAPLLTESNKDSCLLSTTYNPCVTADDLKNSPQSTDFDNMTYSIRIPSCQITMNSSENQRQAEMFCDSAYHPSEGDMMTCPDMQAPATQQNVILPAVVSCLMPTDMSYQCSPDKQAPVQDGQCLSDDQRPFLSFISADQSTPIITDNDYHSL